MLLLLLAVNGHPGYQMYPAVVHTITQTGNEPEACENNNPRYFFLAVLPTT